LPPQTRPSQEPIGIALEPELLTVIGAHGRIERIAHHRIPTRHRVIDQTKEQLMLGRTSLRTIVLALCSVLAVAVSQSGAVAKDKLPTNPKLLVKPPKDAVVLFDGKAKQMHDNWYARRSTEPAGWTVDDKGVATPNSRDITSKQEFGDCYAHVEFCVPLTGHGNSGVGMMGRYEVQILNSYNKKPEAHECGAFYDQTPPKAIASKPAGKWQVYDIFFRAPRFDAKGKLVENARATVYQNHTLIHQDAEFKGPTGIQYEQYPKEAAKGPIVLQGDHDPVQFRNVWILPAKY
jgi:hypothetical protein